MPRKTKKEPTLAEKFRAKLQEKQLSRSSQYARHNMMDKLEDKLENEKLSREERRKIEHKLDLLETLDEKDADYNDDHADIGPGDK